MIAERGTLAEKGHLVCSLTKTSVFRRDRWVYAARLLS
jgi:hypothetical protein